MQFGRNEFNDELYKRPYLSLPSGLPIVQLYLFGFEVISKNPALLRPRASDSRSEGCQPSRKYDCDVRSNGSKETVDSIVVLTSGCG